MAFSITATEYLEVLSPTLSVWVPSATPAWRSVNPSVCWAGPPAKGSNLDVPGADGRFPLPMFDDQAVIALNMYFFGGHDHDGNVQSNPKQGLYDNFAYWRDNVARRIKTGDGTTSAKIHLPDGSTYKSAAITPMGDMRLVRAGDLGPCEGRGVFTFAIAAGQFA